MKTTRLKRPWDAEIFELRSLPRWDEVTHLPHRSWCAACVSGRSRDREHRRLDGKYRLEVPCVVFDYSFLGGEGDEEILAHQIAKDVGTKMFFAHVVPKKGLMVDHGVTKLMKDIDRLGHKKSCFKSVGEPSLFAIQEEVRSLRTNETLLDNSLEGNSRSNGIAERAVQSEAEHIR